MNLSNVLPDIFVHDRIDRNYNKTLLKNSDLTERKFNGRLPISKLKKMYKYVAAQNGLVYENAKHIKLIRNKVQRSLNDN